MLSRSPNNQIVLTRAGDACRKLGELSRAAQYYNKALRLGFDLYAEIGLASLQVIEGDLSQATERLLELRKREPLNARIVQELADCYSASGDPRSAEMLMREFEEQGGKLRS